MLPDIIGDYLMARPRKDAATNAANPEVVSADVLFKQYLVLNDGIVAGAEQQALGITVLTGLVTKADIECAGGDFEWLLSTGAIEEAGYGR